MMGILQRLATILGSVALVVVTILLFNATDKMANTAEEQKENYVKLYEDRKEHEERLQNKQQIFETAMLLLQLSNEIYDDEEFRNYVKSYISESFHIYFGEIFKKTLVQKINMASSSKRELIKRKEISKEILGIEYIGWMYVGDYNEDKEYWVMQPEIFRPEPYKPSLKFEYETTRPRDLLNNEYTLTTDVRIRIGAPLPYGEDSEKTDFVPVKGWLEKGESVKILRIEDARKHPKKPNVKRVWAKVQYGYLNEKK